MKFVPNIHLNKSMKAIEHFITDNSPVILTGIGVIGVATTAALTWAGTKQATEKLADEAFVVNSTRSGTEVYNKDPFTKTEKFYKTWRFYVPAVGSGLITCAAIIGAQKVNARRAAALAGVLAMTQDDIKKYKTKVEEHLTGPKQQKVKEELATERVREIEEAEPRRFDRRRENMVWIIDGNTQQAILSTKERIRRAENDTNQLIDGQESATISDFYDKCGDPQRGEERFKHTDVSDKFGWNTANRLMLEWTAVELADGTPALEFTYVIDPVHNPHSRESFRPQRDA